MESEDGGIPSLWKIHRAARRDIFKHFESACEQPLRETPGAQASCHTSAPEDTSAAPSAVEDPSRSRAHFAVAVDETQNSARLAALHPAFRTLVSALADVYSHRMGELLRFLRVEARAHQSATTDFAAVVLEVWAGVSATLAQCRIQARAACEAEFIRRHALGDSGVRGEGGGLEAQLARAISGATPLKTATDLLPPLGPDPRTLLPEPLPWAALQRRMQALGAQMRRAREVALAAHRAVQNPLAGVDGVQLAERLRSAKDTQGPEAAESASAELGAGEQDTASHPPEGAWASSRWEDVLEQAAQRGREEVAVAAHATAPAARLLALLHVDLAACDLALESLGRTLWGKARHTLLQAGSEVEARSKVALQEMVRQRAHFVRGSVAGERALQKELRDMCAGNEPTWRSVQRAATTIVAAFTDAVRAARSAEEQRAEAWGASCVRATRARLRGGPCPFVTASDSGARGGAGR